MQVVESFIKDCSILFAIRNTLEHLRQKSEDELLSVNAGLNHDELVELNCCDASEGEFMYQYNEFCVIENEILDVVEELLELLLKQCLKRNKDTRVQLRANLKKSEELKQCLSIFNNCGESGTEKEAGEEYALNKFEIYSRMRLVTFDLNNLVEKVSEWITKNETLMKQMDYLKSSTQEDLSQLKKSTLKWISRYKQCYHNMTSSSQQQLTDSKIQQYICCSEA
jgi:hypothetical protein